MKQLSILAKLALASGGSARFVRAMKHVLCWLLVTVAAALGIGAGYGHFESLSVSAAQHYDAKGGKDYAAKFSDWSTKAMLHAMDVCGSQPSTNRYCDIIAVVATDGRIRRVLFAPSNPYAECVRKDLRLGGVAPRPPSDSWPVQIRLIDGPRPKYKGGDKPFIILSAGHVP
jgi:hypothetical protein